MKQIYLLAVTLFFVFSIRAQQDTTFQTPGFFATHDPYMIEATAQQSDGKILVSGTFSHYQGKPVTNIIRLLPSGARDTSFDSAIGTDGTISQILIQADSKIILSGVFSRYKKQVITTGMIRIFPDGTLDNSFIPYKPIYNYNGVVTACLQPDGKFLLAGFGIVPGSGYENFGLIRLNGDGTFDNSFTTQYILKTNEIVNTMAVQSDGKIIVGGSFSEWKGEPCTGIKRLNSNGTPDTSFQLGGAGLRPAINGNITTVQAIRILGDSAILIGGNFGYYDTHTRSGVARLHSNGSLDLSFAPAGVIIPYSIESVAPAGAKIIVGGHFYIGSQAKNIILLNGDGSVDTNAQIPGPDNNQPFTPGVERIFVNTDGSFIASGYFTGYYTGTYHGNLVKLTPGLNFDPDFKNGFQRKGLVTQTAIQPDGKIIVVGDFNQYGLADNMKEQNRIARLLPNGQLDSSFNAIGANQYTNNVAIQSDGNVLIAGSFSSVNNISKKGIARFYQNGLLDNSFNTGAGPNDANIYSMHIDSGQHIYVSGSFSIYNNTIHQGIVRLFSNGDVDQSFDTRGTPVVAPYSIETTVDNKVLAAEGSDLTNRDYSTPLRLYRLNQDGSFDNSFQTPKLGWSISKKVKRGKDNSIYWLGELIQAATPGFFDQTIIRLKENGQLDSSAKRLPKNYYVSDFVLLTDSSLMISGQKINENEDSTFFVLKLKPDLSIDSAFNPVSLYYNLKHVNYTSDNRIVVAGEPIRYFRLQGEQVQNVAILKNSSIQLVDASRNNVVNMLDTVVISETVTNNSANRNFTISNESDQDVVLLDPAKVVLTGANASEFSVTMEKNSTTINKQDSLRFTLKFSPSVAGTKKVRVTIPYSNGIDNKYSFVVTATANMTTPVIDIEGGSHGVEIYPNPVRSGIVYIRTKRKFSRYSIVDIAGHILQQGSISSSALDVFSIALNESGAGIYFLKLNGKGKEASLKMLRQ